GALVTYGVVGVEGDEADRIVREFYDDTVEPYWPPERRHVENGYRDLYFPFQEVAAPELAIKRTWSLPELPGFICTWSAVNALEKARGRQAIADFHAQLHAEWGDPASTRQITWPLSLRVGNV
ncbi:MAG: SAM-dependent methyltransferase, partial [Chlorobiaceae bacterium]|nr:SAM-dependent methyltransferase [Chlorobiaceae bacterium]